MNKYVSKKSILITNTFVFLVGLGVLSVSSNSLAESFHREHPKECNKKSSHKMHHKDKDFSHILKMLQKEVELTDKQTSAITQVIEKYKPEMLSLHEKMEKARKAEMELVKQNNFDEQAVTKKAEESAELMVKMRVMKAKIKHEIHAQLTPEQRQKIEEKFEKHKKG